MIPSVSCLPKPRALRLRSASQISIRQTHQHCNAGRCWTIAVGNPSTVPEFGTDIGAPQAEQVNKRNRLIAKKI